jgi:hypothetical protein
MPDLSREEVLDLLPWLAVGSLSAAESHRVEDWLAQHPGDADVHAELAWLRLTASQVKAEVQAQLPPANQGFESLLQKVRGESAPAVNAPAVSAASPGRQAAAPRPPWLALWQWLRQASPARSLGLAGLALAQAAVIAVLVQRPAEDVGAGQVPLSRLPSMVDGDLLQVSFAPTATEAQIRAALQLAKATLVAGPGAIGVYTVAVPRRAGATSAAALRQQTGVVESVQAVPAR